MRILLTAFEPYGEWPENSSWIALVEFLKNRPSNSDLVTRRYPVDFTRMQASLERDLATGFDAVLHLGQAPGSSTIKLETFAVNAGNSISYGSQGLHSLVTGGPEAYRSRMPLHRWSELLRKSAIPAQVSYHAGTYLCNAVLYMSHHWFAKRNLNAPVGFVHLPLSCEQVAGADLGSSSLPREMLARAIGLIVEDLMTLNIQDDTLASELLA